MIMNNTKIVLSVPVMLLHANFPVVILSSVFKVATPAMGSVFLVITALITNLPS